MALHETEVTFESDNCDVVLRSVGFRVYVEEGERLMSARAMANTALTPTTTSRPFSLQFAWLWRHVI